MNDALITALDGLVPEPQDYGNWPDVLERAGVKRVAVAEAPKRRWPGISRRRAIALALVVIAALVVLFATPALGLILDLIGRKDVSFTKAKPAPAIVKKQFYDLALGLPPKLGPEALAGKAREVGLFRVGGKSHRLWVAPTRHGGYCYSFERLFLGCRADAAERETALLNITYRTVGRPGGKQVVGQIGGDLTAPQAAEIRLDYADGTHSLVPFVYVSKPIDAGFFAYLIPKAHRVPGKGAILAVLLDKKGHVLARRGFRLEPPGRIRTVPIPSPQRPALQTFPPAKSVPLRGPIQYGSDNGVRVLAGRDGYVRFQVGALPAKVHRLVAGRGVNYQCFRMTREFGIFTVRGFGYSGALAGSVGLRFAGIGTPFDGCEIQGAYGHTWPDPLQSHSAAEIAFTPAGQRFFTDRAAARDLALFVRSKRLHELRKLTGRRLVGALTAAYGNRIDRLPRLTARASSNRISYVLTPGGVTFIESSPTGRRFTVIVKKGRITRQNLEPYAFVF
jgi:hypothetical protein